MRLSGNWGSNPERGGTLLATRASGWGANSFFALEPPNGGGTSCINGVSPPFGGFCHPRGTISMGLRHVAKGVSPLAGLRRAFFAFGFSGMPGHRTGTGGGSTSLVGQLPSETKCPVPSDRFCSAPFRAGCHWRGFWPASVFSLSLGRHIPTRRQNSR